MMQTMATAGDMVSALDRLAPDMPVGFATDAGVIGGDYHITELKLAEIRSIDCGGRESRWREAALQLLDGSGEGWMSAGKMAAILKRCIAALPDLAVVPLSVEFAHGNRGLGRYTPVQPLDRGGHAVVALVGDAAQCKPAVDTGCCAVATGCCG
ncbi:DUF6428 family protein [Maritimibacter sp. HL-12]|jgi:hypothetical protein|uniref:DUF6428 family protein n=1 Tax=Maritimibacter sp. HL-12 TaxID=1162418 RepID=UPI000A0F2B99|nr:DUF6428 family protein [Maritimibacter sp. HL-12]SMH41243.1 hypothetical protein SAMN05661107_1223 [Maritimibacter sp. HL-12]